jgi:cytochrome c oxidase subunit II
MKPKLAMLGAGAPALLALGLQGCGGVQSALDPHGLEAEHVARLFWFFTALCGAVWILVVIALGLAISRRSQAVIGDEPLAIDEGHDRKMGFIVGGLVAATTVILIGLTLLSYFSTRGLASPGKPLDIELTGYQWWWDVTYDDKGPQGLFRTANEIHVPVGRPIRITLKAADVIHSFWVPNLTGKQDLIPGQENEIIFTAERPGTYRGQCAEFCGWQHAHMALLVIAEPPEAFESWRAGQLRAAEAPPTEQAASGQRIFNSRACVLCHEIRGTQAGGRVGPDLTHIASRRTLAAGTLPNTPGTLYAWIADPQGVKPGNKMPNVPLQADELSAISDYLRSLD